MTRPRLREPSWASEALLFSLAAFGPLAFGAMEIWSYSLLAAGSFLLLGFCLWRNELVLPDPSLSPIFIFILAILFLGGAQYTNSHPLPTPTTALPFSTSLYGTRQALLAWVTAGAFLLAAQSILRRNGAPERLLTMFVLLGAFVAIVGILQKAQGNLAYYGLRRVTGPVHPFGPYANYNHAAALMNLSVFSGLGLLISRLNSTASHGNLGDRADNAAKQGLFFLLVGLSVAGVFMSGSRGGLNALIATALFALAAFAWGSGLRHSRRAILLIALLVLGIVVYLSALVTWPSLAGNIQANPDFSTSTRLSIYRSTVGLIRDFPYFGTGLGTYYAAFPPYQELWEHRYFVDHAHNELLEFIAEMGVVGLLTAVAAMGVAIARAARDLSGLEGLARTAPAIGALSALAVFVVHSLVEFNFRIPGNLLCFLVLLAAFSRYIESPARRIKEFAPRMRLPAFVLTSILAAASILPLGAEWFRLKATRTPLAGKAYYLTKATKLSRNPRYQYLIAINYLNLSEESGSSREVLLRHSLKTAQPFFESAPFDMQPRRLFGTILWRLGKIGDGSLIGAEVL